MTTNRFLLFLYFPIFWWLSYFLPQRPATADLPLNTTPVCGTDLLPIDDSALAKLDADWAKYVTDPARLTAKAPPYEIPVVFHIVHNNGDENLSDAQIQRALDQLNTAFAAGDNYTTSVNTKISFCLAKRTPDNQPSTGIERIQSAELTDMEMGSEDRLLKTVSRYDANQYLNIWLVENVRSDVYGDLVTGYSSLPSSVGNDHDGIVMESHALTYPVGTWVLLHEVGHYLGLYHTFQGGCNNDNCLTDGDRICDTPPDNSTAGIPCTGRMNSCDTDTNSGLAVDTDDDFRNIMDYGNLECFDRFSPQQAERMQFIMENTRAALANSPGCLFPCDNPVAADFQQVTTEVNAGETVNFTNQSTNATRYEWLLDGQLISRDADLETFFFATGEYRLTLVAYGDDPTSCREDSLSIDLDVGCNIAPNFSYAPIEPLPGEPLFFINESTNATDYEWYVNGELQGEEEDFSFRPAAAGEYIIELTARSEYCEVKATKIIEVGEPKPVAPTVEGLGLPVWLQPFSENNAVDFRNIGTTHPDGIEYNPRANVAFTSCGEVAFYINFSPPLTNSSQLRKLQIITGTDLNEIQEVDEIITDPAKDKIQLIPVPGDVDRWYLLHEITNSLTNLPDRTLVFTTIEKQGDVIQVTDANRPILDTEDDFIIGLGEKVVGKSPNSSTHLQLIALGHKGSNQAQEFLRMHQFVISRTGFRNLASKSRGTVDSSNILSFESKHELTISPSGQQVALFYIRPNIGVLLDLFSTNQFIEGRSLLVNELNIIPTGSAGGLNRIASISEIAEDDSFPLAHLRHIDKSILDIEYSPNEEYIYIVGNGENIPSFIGQISINNPEPSVRLLFTDDGWEYDTTTEQYRPDSNANVFNRINNIENAFDGNFYFSTAKSSTLYQLPEPNALLDQSLIPSPFDWENDEYTDINFGDNNENSPSLPEQIDGYNYLNFTETPFLLTRTDCELNCQAGGKIYLQFEGENLDSFDLVDCPTLVSTCLKDDVQYDLYDPQTGVLLEKVLSGGRVNYPPGGQYFNFLDTAPCGEICYNGIDDDGDGLVDCFDDDCCGSGNCADFYALPCALDGCSFTVDAAQQEEFKLRVELAETVSADDIGNIILNGNPLVGDLDGDGINEIIIPPDGFDDVPNERYLTILFTDTTPYRVYRKILPYEFGMGDLAIVDLDDDGKAEIIFYANRAFPHSLTNRVVCIELTETGELITKWISEQIIRSQNEHSGLLGSTIGVADFNQDGISEIYLGDNVLISTADGWKPILNSLELVDSGNSFSGGVDKVNSVAVDVLPKNPTCQSCEGSELIIGNHVISFDINLTSGRAEDIQVRTLPDHSGGWTSVADVDLDGDLDAIIVNAQGEEQQITYWDIQNIDEHETKSYELPTPVPSAAVIGEINGDGIPDIVFHNSRNLEVVNYQDGFIPVWTKPLTNLVGFFTPIQLFDFTGNREQEIMTYTNNSGIDILDGRTGARVERIVDGSFRRTNFSLIADIDQDGETEIFHSNSNEYTVHRIAGLRAMPLARPIWNQYNWTNTHINDDLTVPAEQQSVFPTEDRQLNQFNTVYAQYDYRVADLEVEILDANCTNIGRAYILKICNQGERDFPNGGTVNFRLQYRYIQPNAEWTDYVSPELISTRTIREISGVPIGTCSEKLYSVSFANPATESNFGNIFNQDVEVRFIAGVNIYKEWGMPYSDVSDLSSASEVNIWRNLDFYIPECDFSNNADTVNLGFFKKLEFPTDTLVCANEPLLLNATDHYATYNWSAGGQDSILSVFTEGNYAVTVTDDCGFEQTAEIEVRYRQETVLDLGDTLVSCDNAPIVVEMTEEFVGAQWFPSDYLSCDTCTTVTITPTEEIEYIVIGETREGCYSVDTVQIIKANSVETFVDTSVCIGATLFYENENLAPNDTYEFIYESSMGCDSTVYLTVTENENLAYYETIELPTCANDTTVVENRPLAAGDTLVIEYQTVSGCDSNFTYVATPLPIYETTEKITLCAGDSTLIFNENISNTGVYTQVFPAANGCDSTHTIEVEVLENIAINLQNQPPCPDQTDGEITATVTGGLPPYNYHWSNGVVGNDARISDLPAGEHSLTITDANGCTSTFSTTLDYFATFDLELEKTDITCYGAADGSIEIFTNQNIQTSLNGERFVQKTRFDQLAAGDYDLYIQDENGCLIHEPFTITEPAELQVELPTEIALQMGDSLQLRPIFNTDTEMIYQWQPTEGLSCADCPNPVARPLRNEIYTLQVTDNQNCSATTTTRFIVNQQVPIYFPTAFSPNDDGNNDLWQPYAGTGVKRLISIHVFDRWGDQVFYWEPKAGQNTGSADAPIWDGQVRGKRAATGVYVYAIEVEYVDGRTEILRGDFLLLR